MYEVYSLLEVLLTTEVRETTALRVRALWKYQEARVAPSYRLSNSQRSRASGTVHWAVVSGVYGTGAALSWPWCGPRGRMAGLDRGGASAIGCDRGS